jgi:hypothetical protein
MEQVGCVHPPRFRARARVHVCAHPFQLPLAPWAHVRELRVHERVCAQVPMLVRVEA